MTRPWGKIPRRHGHGRPGIPACRGDHLPHRQAEPDGAGRGDELIQSWAHATVRAAAPAITVTGAEHLDRRGRGACILMSNHQSHFDIPILLSLFPGTLRMVAKEELFHVPVWGQAMRSTGFIAVDRSGNRARARVAMEHAARAVREGISIWLAPEGTRSEDGTLGTFKKGGFHLALDTGAPIVPVVIDGSRHILPKHGGFKVHRGVPVRVVAGPAIDVEGRDLAQLMREVRAFMEQELELERELERAPEPSRSR